MKKTLKRSLILLLAVAMLVSCVACSSSSSSTPAPSASGDPAPSDQAPVAEKVNIRMATGGPTGVYYAYGGAIAQVFNEKLTDYVNINVNSTGASKANIFLIADGEADMAIVQNDVMDYGYNGIDLFSEDGAVKGFSAMAALYPEICQIIATPDIKSVADLHGKRVSVGDAGSGVEFNARQILEAYGMTFEDITVNNLGFGDSAEAYKDGKIDAFFCVAGVPTTAISDLAATNEFTLVNVDDEHVDVLRSKYPYYSKVTIPASAYSGLEADAQTVAVKATFIVSDKLSEETVYQMTKGLFEYKAEITAGNAKGEDIDVSYAVESVSIPFHPGAEKYFKEVGALS